MLHHKTQPTLFPGEPQHGAATQWISAHYPDAPRPVIDLSTGINPYPYTLPPVDEALYHRLADPQEMQAAREACRIYYGVGEKAVPVLASGMQPLIFALAATRPPSRVAIIGPTYGEHKRVWEACGHAVQEVTALADVPPSAEVVVLCNPNNPTGRCYPPEFIREHLAGFKNKPLLVIDESFADLKPEMSFVPQMESLPNAVILRSLGKFFGVAGMRVSIALCHEPIARMLEVAVGPWPISTPACCWLPAMLADGAWRERTRKQLSEESAAWQNILKQYFTIIGATDLFILVQVERAGAWHEWLASQGIAVRNFHEHPAWLRFGLPTGGQLPRVAAALQGFEP